MEFLFTICCFKTILFTIPGIFDPDAPHPKLPHSPLYKPLMDTSIMPAGFIVDLITITSNNGWEEFKTVFSPLITCLGKIHHALKK